MAPPAYAVLILGAIGAFRAHAAAAEKTKPEDCVPQRVVISVARLGGPSYSLEGGSELEYRRIMPGRRATPVKITPTNEQWCEFRRRLRDIGVSRWKRTYEAPMLADGASWMIAVTYRDTRLSSEGTGAYPGARGEPVHGGEQTEAFRKLMEAVRALTGSRAFE